MRNDELFDPNCKDKQARRLVLAYALRGLLDSSSAYTRKDLLSRQYAVYKEWLGEVCKHTPGFSCGFYEWMSRDCDSAFVLTPGDLVKYDGRYCVVTRWCPDGISWEARWRISNGVIEQKGWPFGVSTVELKDPSGRTYTRHVLDGNIEPADIPHEVFALACEKAKDCPMRGGR